MQEVSYEKEIYKINSRNYTGNSCSIYLFRCCYTAALEICFDYKW